MILLKQCDKVVCINDDINHHNGNYDDGKL